jgi:ornithine carbamoyltransferase
LRTEDLSNDQVEDLLDLATFLKQRRKLAPSVITPVEGRTVAMLFEKQSLRTRVSFEAAVVELGGHPIYLTKNDIAMGQRESIKDVAGNLSRWCQAVVARLYWQRDIEQLAEHCTVPVINALTELEHPCQALADLMTIREAFGDERVKICYIGDGNNVARSLGKLAGRLGYPFVLAGPKNFHLEEIEGIVQTEDLEQGVRGASVVYTDVWISMGDEHEQEHRLKVFRDWQVNADVMAMADPDSIFMHCLPARRGFEVTDEVIDSTASRVDDQAENRLHAQKALLQRVLGVPQR